MSQPVFLKRGAGEIYNIYKKPANIIGTTIIHLYFFLDIIKLMQFKFFPVLYFLKKLSSN